MESKAKLFGHPIHQMLIVFPLGLLATALAFDILHFVSGNGYWSEIAYRLIAAGVLAGFIAAPFGFIDWLAIPSRTRAKRVGAWHGGLNAAVLALFALSWAFRGLDPRAPSYGAYILAFGAGALAIVAGWLGGELVDRLGVGVDDGANLDAPSSLRSPRIRG